VSRKTDHDRGDRTDGDVFVQQTGAASWPRVSAA
jgi:hypothetical protein